MGALIFYTAIYFLGYYAAHLLNPHGHDEEISHALGFYIILPVIVIVIAVAIRIWQESGDRDIP